MKKLMITALALAAMATTPALAQTYITQTRAVPLVDNTYMLPGTSQNLGYEAYGLIPGGTLGPQPGVYVDGHYVGWDPDPSIRFQLMRDPGIILQ